MGTSQVNIKMGNKGGQHIHKERRISKVGAQEAIENRLSPKEVPERIPLTLQSYTEHSLKTTAMEESVSAFKVQCPGPGPPRHSMCTGLHCRRAKL